MFLGGIDGFLQLCRSLREYDEFKYQYPGSKCDYTQIENDIEMCVSKRSWQGTLCFDIKNFSGEQASIAQNGCGELLKIKNLILASAKK